MIVTDAGLTLATPPMRIPDPPFAFSKQLAPACTANLPAIALMGVNKG